MEFEETTSFTTISPKTRSACVEHTDHGQEHAVLEAAVEHGVPSDGGLRREDEAIAHEARYGPWWMFGGVDRHGFEGEEGGGRGTQHLLQS